MQKYAKYVKICKNHPRHLYKFLLGWPRGSWGPATEPNMGREGDFLKTRLIFHISLILISRVKDLMGLAEDKERKLQRR